MVINQELIKELQELIFDFIILYFFSFIILSFIFLFFSSSSLFYRQFLILVWIFTVVDLKDSISFTNVKSSSDQRFEEVNAIKNLGLARKSGTNNLSHLRSFNMHFPFLLRAEPKID